MRHFTVRNTAYVLFELDEEELRRLAQEAGFQASVEQHKRALVVHLQAREPRAMFFDAADKRQAARLALARTFAHASTGVVYNTPFVLQSGEGSRVTVRIATEVRWDTARRYPRGPTESSVLSLFAQLAQDLAAGMVGLCGTQSEGRVVARTAP